MTGIRRKVPIGPTGLRVAGNVRLFRTNRGLTVRALSVRLGEVGHPILPSGVTKIETGDRAVNVDDLVALAQVLGCSPDALLGVGVAPDGVLDALSVVHDSVRRLQVSIDSSVWRPR